MVKQPTNKDVNNLGHNNLPVNPKSLEFNNSAIEKLKVDSLDFGNKKFLSIPFNVPRGSHLKGMTLLISKSSKTKKFRLRFWMSGRNTQFFINY